MQVLRFSHCGSMEIDSYALPGICAPEKPSETDRPEIAVPERVTRSSRLRIENGLGADVIGTPTQKGRLSLWRARSATLRSSNDQKRRRVTQDSIDPREVDYHDKVQPLDAVQRPKPRTTPARFGTQDEDEGGRGQGKDSSHNTTATTRVNHHTRKRAKDEADGVLTAETHLRSAVQSLGSIPDGE